MICIIALIVFGALGIFSVKYRIIAKEALDCVFRRVTLRKCETGLDKRLKAQITGNLMKKSPSVGRWLYKRFEIISWIFLILLLVSLFYTGQAVYYYARYGNCNGPDSNAFCIFDPLNTFGGHDEGEVCSDPNLATDKELKYINGIEGHPTFGPDDAPITIIEFGCFSCPNTKAVIPAVKRILEEYASEVKLVFLDFPLPTHDYSFDAAIAVECVWMNQPELYWNYHFGIFESEKELSDEMLKDIALEKGIDMELFNQCFDNEESRVHIDEDYKKGLESNIYGTPTFFINEEPVIGAVSYNELKKVIEKKLKE